MADTTRFFSIEQLADMEPPKWMIDEMFEKNSLVMVAGPPASFKSFLVLDWLLCMACGRKWQGKHTESAKVLYVLGEGRASLLKRIQVWIHYNRLTEEELSRLATNFKVTFEVPQMASKSSVDNMLAGLVQENFAPEVIAVDTFARSFVGMDENSQKDVGLWVESADRLRSLGYTVIFLHHTAKNTEFGVRYRGSTAIMGAMDTAMTLVRDQEIPNGVRLTITKQKDHDEGDPTFFNRVIVTPPGMAEGSIVLVPTLKKDDRFSEDAKKMNKMVDDLMKDPSFESDRARARELTRHFDIGDEAAQKRISRARRIVLPPAAVAGVL